MFVGLKNRLGLLTRRCLLVRVTCLASACLLLACEKPPEPPPIEVSLTDLRDPQYVGKRVVLQGYLRLDAFVMVWEENNVRSCDILLRDKPLSQDPVKVPDQKPNEFVIKLIIKLGEQPYNLIAPPASYSPADLKVRTPEKIVGADDLVKVFAKVRYVFDSVCRLEIERVEVLPTPASDLPPAKVTNAAMAPVKKTPPQKSSGKEK